MPILHLLLVNNRKSLPYINIFKYNLQNLVEYVESDGSSSEDEMCGGQTDGN